MSSNRLTYDLLPDRNYYIIINPDF